MRHLYLLVLLVYIQVQQWQLALAYEIEPGLLDRKGGIAHDKKRSLILDNKVFMYKPLLDVYAEDNRFKADADYNIIAVCSGTMSGKMFSDKTRTFYYFACPAEADHEMASPKMYCCGEESRQHCCEKFKFGNENDISAEKSFDTGVRLLYIFLGVIAGGIALVLVTIAIFCFVIMPRRKKQQPVPAVRSVATPTSYSYRPGQTYGSTGAYPGANPGANPGAYPGANRGAYPGANPGANPGAYPGANPGAYPGANPESNNPPPYPQ